MKVVNTAAVGLVAVLASLPGPTRGGGEDPRRERLIAARDAWYEAFFRGDTDALAKFEAEDFLAVNPQGIYDKAEQLRHIKRAVEAGKWFPKGTSQVADDLRIRFEGGLAVLTCRYSNKGGPNSAPSERAALTEVWVERGGAWRALHLHYSGITTEGPR